MSLLSLYSKKLIEWNQKINLTGASSVEEFEQKHIQDVIEALKVYQPQASVVVDVGSGGGLPGVPIAVLTGRKVFLVERRGKKATAVRSILEELQIKNCESVTGSFEEMWPKLGLGKDVEIWMRAVLPGPKLIRFLSDHFQSDALPRIVLMKGPGWSAELSEALMEKGVNKAWVERFKKSKNLSYRLPGGIGDRSLVLL